MPAIPVKKKLRPAMYKATNSIIVGNCLENCVSHECSSIVHENANSAAQRLVLFGLPDIRNQLSLDCFFEIPCSCSLSADPYGNRSNLRRSRTRSPCRSPEGTRVRREGFGGVGRHNAARAQRVDLLDCLGEER
jgi:hypothetical protein